MRNAFCFLLFTLFSVSVWGLDSDVTPLTEEETIRLRNLLEKGRDTLEKLQIKLTSLQNSNEQLSNSQKQLQKQLKQAAEQQSRLNLELNQMQTELAKSKTELASSDQSLTKAVESSDAREREIELWKVLGGIGLVAGIVGGFALGVVLQ